MDPDKSLNESFLLFWTWNKLQKNIHRTFVRSNFCHFRTHRIIFHDHLMAGNRLTDDLVQDLLDDDPLHGDQDVLHELRVGRCCLKTLYRPRFISVVWQEFLFQKFSKKDKSYNTLASIVQSFKYTLWSMFAIHFVCAIQVLL